MICQTSYAKGSQAVARSGKMQNYMKKDAGKPVKLKNHKGEETSFAEQQEFREKVEDSRMWRHLGINPDPEADISQDELDRGVRETMSKMKEERPSLEYQYALHGDSSDRLDIHNHAHVIMTGKQEDLEVWKDQGDLEEIEGFAEDAFNENEKLSEETKIEEMSESLEKSFGAEESMDMTEGASR